MEMRMTKETDIIENDDREIVWKEQCSNKEGGDCKENKWRKNNTIHDMQEGYRV